MHRFFCQPLPAPPATAGATRGTDVPPSGGLSDGIIAELDADQSRHARRVLRLRAGDAVELFDGAGVVATGAIEPGDGPVRVRLKSARSVPPLRPAVELATAIPKGPRAETMIDELSQLGVARVIPLRTSRSVVHPRPNKLERFARNAIESAKQCGRAHVMQVEPVTTLRDVLDDGPPCRLIASPAGPSDRASRVQLRDALNHADRVLVLVGPEGGWTDEELALAASRGCTPWQFAPHVLRIQTAAVAAAAVLRYLIDEG